MKMKNRNCYEKIIRGWREAVAAVQDGVFLPDGMPANDITARRVFSHLAGAAAARSAEVAFDGQGAALPSPVLYGVEAERLRRRGLTAQFARAFFARTGRANYRSVSNWRELRARNPGVACSTFSERLRRLPLSPETFRYDGAVGVEIECFGTIERAALVDRLPIWCGAVDDGSIRAEFGVAHEVRCLLVRRELEPRLFRLCARLGALGLKVNRSCGLHVHIDQRGQTHAQVLKRARIVDSWLSALQELVPASRRDNSYARFGVSLHDRYRAVNFSSFARHATLEIRLHGGTIDYTKILSWIRLIEMLAALVRRPRPGGCLAVLDQLPLPEHDKCYWRARHAALNPTLYTSAAAAAEVE